MQKKSFRIITFSQLWLYLGKTFLAHFVGHNTDYKTIWLLFLNFDFNMMQGILKIQVQKQNAFFSAEIKITTY